MILLSLIEMETDKKNILDNLVEGGVVQDDWVVMGNNLPSGGREVTARYGDDIWVLPTAIMSQGAKVCHKKLDFNRLNFKSHVEPLKRAISFYYLKGLPGSGVPRGGSVVQLFKGVVVFLNYLSSIGVEDITKTNTIITSQYVKHCKSLSGTKKGSVLTPAALSSRLHVIETLHTLLEGTSYSFKHPWPESSARVISKNFQSKEGKTKIIPDNVAQIIMQASFEWLKKADYLLDCQSAVAEEKTKGESPAILNKNINKALLGRGYDKGFRQLRKDVNSLRSACAIIILITTGIRVHELLSLKRNCSLSRFDKDGDRQLWIKGVSQKTKEGATEWLCPELCHQAVKVLERLVVPTQALLELQISSAKNEAERHEYNKNTDSLFLSISQVKGNEVWLYSSSWLGDILKKYVKECGVDWVFSTHQCRRTFAVYVVRSALGDLRYLREHFKHWSIDMTAMYAANQEQDKELYDEIFMAMVNTKQGKVAHWLDPETPVAGGMGEKIKIFRSKGESVRAYGSHADMIKGVSDTISLRATGVAWCTADTNGCNGGKGVDRTKCGDCDGSIIDDKQQSLWNAIYYQQLELVNLDDIGEQGKITARRALRRCEKVLSDLGADVEKLKEGVAG